MKKGDLVYDYSQKKVEKVVGISMKYTLVDAKGNERTIELTDLSNAKKRRVKQILLYKVSDKLTSDQIKELHNILANTNPDTLITNYQPTIVYPKSTP